VIYLAVVSAWAARDSTKRSRKSKRQSSYQVAVRCSRVEKKIKTIKVKPDECIWLKLRKLFRI
jgi:hypothetical protein